MRKLPLIVFLLASSTANLHAQLNNTVDTIISFPERFFSLLDKKTSSIEDKLNKKTEKYLSKLQHQENKLKKRLWKKDSVLAKQIFSGVEEKYAQLRKLSGNVNKYTAVYSGHLDSLATALNFLQNQSLSNNPELQKVLEQYNTLQLKLNASDQISKYIAERREILKQQFQNLGMIKELKKFRKEVYYYQSQVKAYKEMFEDPNRIEEKLLSLVMKIPEFKDFFARNSMLGSLFALPGNTNNTTGPVSGLQTRQMVNQSIIDRFGSGPNVNQQLQQNIQSAQGQLNALKNKLSSYTSGSYGNWNGDDIPNFKPNSQKTRSLKQRLEFGSNIQTQRARYFFPVTSDIALSIGYKLNDKSIFGLGCSYKVGWGSNWSNIKITHQGIGLRSFIDWQLRGQLYVSGGYEQNYRNLIHSIDQLRNYSAWQQSALLGLSKKYAVGKKLKGEMKLMWDFLSYSQVPRSEPFVFRIGYSLK